MKYNLSQIMKNAWNMVKTMGMTMSAALKSAWASAKSPLKQLCMKDWFANKTCRELRRNLHSADIFAVLRETEKAIYVMLREYGKPICIWVPKSCVESVSGSADFHTLFNVSYETAAFEHRLFWSAY